VRQVLVGVLLGVLVRVALEDVDDLATRLVADALLALLDLRRGSLRRELATSCGLKAPREAHLAVVLLAPARRLRVLRLEPLSQLVGRHVDVLCEGRACWLNGQTVP